MVLPPLQAQEDLRLAKTTDHVSADLKRAEMTIQQMSAEIEALMEKLKVGSLPGAAENRILKDKDRLISEQTQHWFLQVTQTSALTDRQVEEGRILDLQRAVKNVSSASSDLSNPSFRAVTVGGGSCVL